MVAAREGEHKSNEEEIRSLQIKVRSLQSDLEDSEYKNQMTSRQYRREKTQIEKAVHEKETKIGELNQHVEETEEKYKTQLEEYTKECDKLKETTKCHEKKIENLEEVIHDLKSCLQSSKDAQEGVSEQVEKYKQKSRDLEDKIIAADDQIQLLNHQVEEVCISLVIPIHTPIECEIFHRSNPKWQKISFVVSSVLFLDLSKTFPDTLSKLT